MSQFLEFSCKIYLLVRSFCRPNLSLSLSLDFSLSIYLAAFLFITDNIAFSRGPLLWECGSVAEWLGRWTCDQQVAGSNPGLPVIEYNPGQVVNTHAPVSLSSIIWYQPMGGDALRLGK